MNDQPHKFAGTEPDCDQCGATEGNPIHRKPEPPIAHPDAPPFDPGTGLPPE
jgi:hypothetical protein